MTRWVVIGAGYTGARIADTLRTRGDDVVCTRRRDGFDLATATVEDIAAFVRGAAVVVVTAPPSDETGAAEAKLADAAARAGVERIVYISSTGVYGAAEGAWVDEDFPTTPLSPSGRARLAAEHALAAGSVTCRRLRAAGIWGPGRGAVERLRAGTYRVIGDGESYVSRVHVDDLAQAAVLAGDARVAASVYNVADDDPCTTNDLVAEAVRLLGVAEPARVGLAEVDADVVGMFTANRRIDSRRLQRDLGWTPRYRSWKSGIDAL